MAPTFASAAVTEAGFASATCECPTFYGAAAAVEHRILINQCLREKPGYTCFIVKTLWCPARARWEDESSSRTTNIQSANRSVPCGSGSYGRVKAGLTRVCETCGHRATFDSQSEDMNVRQALHAARRYRRSLISVA